VSRWNAPLFWSPKKFAQIEKDDAFRILGKMESQRIDDLQKADQELAAIRLLDINISSVRTADGLGISGIGHSE
jgi:hypothetical protein